MKLGVYFRWYGVIGVLKFLGLRFIRQEEREDLRVEVGLRLEKTDLIETSVQHVRGRKDRETLQLEFSQD